ncbi:ABC transporter permease [Corallococcus praedator]|uniref:ABC transporter permease n=1 Tax=Corallococcus praedator TaxID=2316724 RepID=A0ABX9QK80_9BACT|nr:MULTISPECIES: putative ABC exporter domain-containing protein [Corallococcus]RKH16254.1 ABC transporter permease [Corallococcus sp. CA047B]RKH31588.1 ABC transporter permease [Corallococcus sp. CA031C]RKI10679.1 ABC transporter permease [Corallococcus praedator]
MSFPRAVAFLWARTWRNRLVRQVQRLKRPRYLLGALVGLAYLYSLVGRSVFVQGTGRAVSPNARMFAEFSLEVSVLGTLVTAWVLGADRPALTFTQTEVQYFFPAPVTRKALLHYKLLRGLLSASLAALAATVFVGRFTSPRPELFFLGAALAMGTLYLHGTAASFVRAWLVSQGRWGSAVRWTLVGLLMLAVMGTLVTTLQAHPWPANAGAPFVVRGWVRDVLDAPGPRAVLWPGRALVAPSMARSTQDFLRYLPASLALLVAHYAWVLAVEVPFEDSAVAGADARTRQQARRGNRSARGGNIRVGRVPFLLKARGRPEVALVWKNLIARKRLGGGLVVLLGFVVMGALVALVLGDTRLFSNTRELLGPMSLMVAVAMAVIGPSAFRTDLRMDLPKLELLRALPLTGRQVVGAELAASALTLSAAQWVMLLVALVLGVGTDDETLAPWSTPVVLGLLSVLPALGLAGLFVQNAAVVLLPAWIPADSERARGVEALGQRLLTLVGTLVVTFLGLLPAAVVALLVGYPLFTVMGRWAVPLAGLVAAGALFAEVALGVAVLGRAFERLDVSEEQSNEG